MSPGVTCLLILAAAEPGGAGRGADMLEFNIWSFLFAMVNFLILVGLLYKFLHGPLLAALEKRRKGIEDARKSAEQKEREAEKARSEYRQKLDEIEQERDRLLSEARNQAEGRREELLKQARAEAEREAVSLKRAWESERREALGAMQEEIADAALDLTGRILGELADADLESRLNEKLLERLAELEEGDEAERRGLFEAGLPVRVVSARKIARGDRAKMRKAVASLAGQKVDVEFDTDESLVAGARVEFASAAVDCSLADVLAATRERFDELAEEPDEEPDEAKEASQ